MRKAAIGMTKQNAEDKTERSSKGRQGRTGCGKEGKLKRVEGACLWSPVRRGCVLADILLFDVYLRSRVGLCTACSAAKVAENPPTTRVFEEVLWFQVPVATGFMKGCFETKASAGQRMVNRHNVRMDRLESVRAQESNVSTRSSQM